MTENSNTDLTPEVPQPGQDSKSCKKQQMNPAWLWTRDIAVCLILVLLFRTNVAEANYIPSPSMEPTLQISDRIIVDKISLKWHPLERGELVVFHPPIKDREHERWIKRAIGLPGDSIEILRGAVYINGEKLDESYVQNPGFYSKGIIKLSRDDPGTKADESEYYFLGDNRRNSRDSHVWGTCPGSNVIGRAVFRYWPLGHMGMIDGSDDIIMSSE